MDLRSRTSDDPTHIDLLTMAHAVRGAVVEDDTEQVHSLLCRLRADLVTHLRHERERLPGGSPGSLRAVVVDGQRRLMALLDEVMLGLGGEPVECNCLLRAVEIEVALRRQARLEATILSRGEPRPARDRSGR